MINSQQQQFKLFSWKNKILFRYENSRQAAVFPINYLDCSAQQSDLSCHRFVIN